MKLAHPYVPHRRSATCVIYTVDHFASQKWKDSPCWDKRREGISSSKLLSISFLIANALRFACLVCNNIYIKYNLFMFGREKLAASETSLSSSQQWFFYTSNIYGYACVLSMIFISFHCFLCVCISQTFYFFTCIYTIMQ